MMIVQNPNSGTAGIAMITTIQPAPVGKCNDEFGRLRMDCVLVVTMLFEDYFFVSDLLPFCPSVN